MAGVKALRKIQMGKESTAGTIVAATTLWRGMGTLDDQREVVFPTEDVGIISGTTRSYVRKLGGAISLESVEATFEQLPHILEAGVKQVGSGVVDTGGSGYVYSYPMTVDTINTVQTYSIEGGDNQQAEVMEYSYVESFELTGTAGEAIMMSASLLGRQVQNQAFTGSVSIPTVEEILFTKARLYIDASGGTIGATQLSDTLLGFALSVKTGLIPKYTANGELYFQFAQMTAPEVTLQLTYEHNGSAVAEKTAWRDLDTRLMRLEIDGSALSSAGTFTYKTLRIDLAGIYEDFEPLGDQDGNDILTCTLRARYSPADALFAEFVVVNELSAIP